MVFCIGDWVDLDFDDDLPVASGVIMRTARGWCGAGKIYNLFDIDGKDIGWYTETRFVLSVNPSID